MLANVNVNKTIHLTRKDGKHHQGRKMKWTGACDENGPGVNKKCIGEIYHRMEKEKQVGQGELKLLLQFI